MELNFLHVLLEKHVSIMEKSGNDVEMEKAQQTVLIVLGSLSFVLWKSSYLSICA